VVSDIAFDIISVAADDADAGCHTLDRLPLEIDHHAKNTLSAKYADADIDEALSEIRELIREDMLFTGDDPITSVVPESRDPVIKAMCLHVAHDCNMRCAY
jgi:uncharacterized protein